MHENNRWSAGIHDDVILYIRPISAAFRHLFSATLRPGPSALILSSSAQLPPLPNPVKLSLHVRFSYTSRLFRRTHQLRRNTATSRKTLREKGNSPHPPAPRNPRSHGHRRAAPRRDQIPSAPRKWTPPSISSPSIAPSTSSKRRPDRTTRPPPPPRRPPLLTKPTAPRPHPVACLRCAKSCDFESRLYKQLKEQIGATSTCK